jgi:hypothetical protein
MHGLDAHDLGRVAREGALAGIAERGDADLVGVDEHAVAEHEPAEQIALVGEQRVRDPDLLGHRLCAQGAGQDVVVIELLIGGVEHVALGDLA